MREVKDYCDNCGKEIDLINKVTIRLDFSRASRLECNYSKSYGEAIELCNDCTHSIGIKSPMLTKEHPEIEDNFHNIAGSLIAMLSKKATEKANEKWKEKLLAKQWVK